jgi:predicted RND superfamily exporter protein
MISLKSGLLIVFLLMTVGVFAGDSIIITKDARLDILTQKQKLMNRRLAMQAGNGLYKGYRIQVTSTSSRDEAFRLKAELMNRFPENKTYTIYQSPNFKVRIGNFIKKEEAEKFKAQLNKMYPQGVYIVEDNIEYSPKEEDLPVQ